MKLIWWKHGKSCWLNFERTLYKDDNKCHNREELAYRIGFRRYENSKTFSLRCGRGPVNHWFFTLAKFQWFWINDDDVKMFDSNKKLMKIVNGFTKVFFFLPRNRKMLFSFEKQQSVYPEAEVRKTFPRYAHKPWIKTEGHLIIYAINRKWFG